MADITSLKQGEVNPSGMTNWRGDQVSLTPGAQSPFKTSSVKLAEPGSRLVVGDRVFRYALAAGTFAAGNVLESQPETLINVTAGATDAAGNKVFTWYAATAMAADTYANGYLIAQSGTAANIGYTYRVRTHAAIGATTNGSLYLEDELAKAVNVTDKYTLMQNMYNSVLQCTTGSACLLAGVAPVSAVSGDYLWIQTWGPCSVKNAAGGKGTTMIADVTGQCIQLVSTASAGVLVYPIVGMSMQTLTASERGMVFLTIAP
jgi:hypothetical protein